MALNEPATAKVRVTYTTDDVTIEIDDDGRGSGGALTAGGGNGIPGMCERAAVLDPFAHLVCTDDGEVFEYDGLVLATGAAPVVPPGWPVGYPRLRTASAAGA